MTLQGAAVILLAVEEGIEVLTYRMTDGRATTDVEQFLRWVAGYANVTPELAEDIRARDKADRRTDRVIDAAAAKFEDRA